MDRSDPIVRRSTTDDIPAAVEVAAAALGWDPHDPNEAFFRWKHLDNPAGPSPMWVAADGDEIVGFRTMVRWRFLAPGGAVTHAVRAVDTATRPDHQRRGIFRALTTTAVTELAGEGIDFVFNTPNDSSRPGYLQMGWRDAGRLPARFAIFGPRALPRLLRARTAATKWSELITVGDPVTALADDLSDLLSTLPEPTGLATDRTVEHLLWRYSFAPLHYRVIRVDNGAAIVRVRRRGAATEVVLAEALSPDRATTRSLLMAIRRSLSADHLLALADPPHPAPWLPTLPTLGPRLTIRDLASTAPDLSAFRFALGDIELF